MDSLHKRRAIEVGLQNCSELFDKTRYADKKHVNYDLRLRRLSLLALIGMLKNNGDVVGFADHMTYLYWTEPANFTLLSLIYSKVLQSMCDESKVQAKGLDVVAKEVMTIFASFVAPIYSHRSILYNPNITGGGSPSSISKVVLERLPDEVRSVLQQHNREVIKHFVATIKSVLHGCPEGFLKLVDELPMSKVRNANMCE